MAEVAAVKVLVIDDEEGMREGMRRVLERRGYTVDTAPDGSVAIDLLKEQSYDIALVDLKMPVVDGFQVTKFINEHHAERTVVVIVSALATVEAAVEVTQRGAFDFLVKPFAPPDLMQVVERAATQRRLIQERETYLSELNRERNLSRQLINSLREGVIVVNISGKTVLMNPRAEFLLGVSLDDSLDLNDLLLDEEIATGVRGMLSGKHGEGEYRQFSMKRQDLMLQIRATPYVRNNEFGGLIISIGDVTEEWQADQDKNMFISMVAHELTSPLAAIINYIGIVLSGLFDNEIDKIKEVMERSKIRGEALLDLIRDLQYLNKREAGKVEKSVESLDLRAVLEEQIEFLRVQAERRGITIDLDVSEHGIHFSADRGDMDRVFMNLISNGIKYNREGGRLTLTVTRRPESLIIGVADTGIGMSPKEAESLFQEFYRVKNAKTQGISGTGLGLATVKRVLGGYNGTISVESIPDEGTTFTVELPTD